MCLGFSGIEFSDNFTRSTGNKSTVFNSKIGILFRIVETIIRLRLMLFFFSMLTYNLVSIVVA